jgi:hypothetical protein
MNSPSPNYGGNAPAIPGFGYPGDAARSRYGVPTLDPSFRPNNPVGGDINFPDGSGGQQSNRLTELKSRYDRGEIPFEQLFEQYNLPSKYPEVSAATQKAFGDVAKTDAGVGDLDFNAMKKQFAGAEGDMNRRYNEFQAGNDISGYAATQRALDAQAAGLTNEYEARARGELDKAAGVGERYRTEGQGALDKYLGNAQDFYNKDIPAAIADAQNRAVQYTSRYGMGRGGGLSSAIGGIAGKEAIRASLPFQLQGRQYMGDALSRYQPFYGDVAARDFNRIAGLNMPTEQNIFATQQGDVMRSKGTEQQIQNLDMLVKERGLQAAVQNLKNQGLSQSMINALVGEWQATKSRSLGLTGQAAGINQEYGDERGYNYIPGSGPVTQSQYYPLPMPNYPNNSPGRYPPQNPTGGGPGGYPNGNMNGSEPKLDQYGRPMSPKLNRYGNPMSPAEQYTDKNGMPSNYGGQGGSPGTGRYITGDANNWYGNPDEYWTD